MIDGMLIHQVKHREELTQACSQASEMPEQKEVLRNVILNKIPKSLK